MIERVVSGGQTGVDRAALDVALAAGVDCGGWCPRGRRAEDGPIPDRYPLSETDSGTYIARTRQNVEDSDGTLIITRSRPTGGTRRTAEHARHIGKPMLVVDLKAMPENRATALDDVRNWIAENGICVLNIAGPRESTRPGIHDAATAFLRELLAPDGG